MSKIRNTLGRIKQNAALHVKAVCVIAHAHLFNFMAKRGMVLGANTLTGLIPTFYEAMDQVSRELVGFIPAVSRSSTAARVAMGQEVHVPVVGAHSASDITPGVTAPDNGDNDIGYVPLTITKSRGVPVRWNGEETLALSGSGMMPSIASQRFAQAMRTLTNEVEADLAALHVYASRAYGTPGTTPYGTAGDLSDSAEVLKLLEQNGAPLQDLHAVNGSNAIANLRGKQSVLFKVNEAGTSDMLRRGIIGDIHGIMQHNSPAVKTHTKGTAAGATTNNAGYAVGATVITLAAAGTGTVVTGDVVSFAGDSNKYVVASGDADVSNGGTITIAEPGLRVAIPTANTAITVANSSARNMVFARSSIALATRAPAMPDGGDSADDVLEVQDPVSGLVFQIALYRQYRQVRYEVGLAWGVKMVAPRHSMLLLG